VDERLALRRRQAGRDDQLVVEAIDGGAIQLPRRVLGAGGANARRCAGEEPEASGQPVVERRELVGAVRRADAHPDRRGGATGPGPTTAALVVDVERSDVDRHVGPEVRQAVGRPGRGDGGEPRCIERQEPHAGRTVLGAGVRADVGLGESREPRYVAAPGQGDAHLERHESDPRPPVVLVDREPAGQEPLHDLDGVAPVQEREVGPAMVHHGALHHERTLAGVVEPVRYGRELIGLGHAVTLPGSHTYV